MAGTACLLVPVGRQAMKGVSDAEVWAWLHASCAAQGVPEVVSDPATVGAVAVLLTGRAGGPPGSAAGARRAGRAPRLQPPVGLDSGGPKDR
jgi:hypothetical protein